MANALIQAKDILAKRRANAEYKAEENLSKVMRYDDYKNADDEVRAQILVTARAHGTDKEQAEKDKLAQLKQKRVQVAAAHGYTAKELTPQYGCKLCGDTGRTENGQCKCLTAEIRRILFGVNDLNGNASFDNADVKGNEVAFDKALQWCQAYPTVKRKQMLILGLAGVGKTYLCNCIANKLLEKGVALLMLTAYDLNGKFLAIHTAPIEEKNLLTSSLFNVDVLIIDDLGTEPLLRNVTEEYLFSLLNYRRSKGLSTIVSSNLDMNKLLERYSERTFSRLTDTSATLPMNIVGRDRRIKK